MTDAMTRLMQTGVVVAAVVLAVGVDSATAISIGNSATWEGSYEADDFPENVGWGGGLSSGGSISSGILSYSGVGNVNKYDITNIDTTTNGGLSWEFRMKLNAGSFFLHTFTTGANYRWNTVEITAGSVGIGDSGTGTDTYAIDATEWHTYGVTSDDTNWYLYLDGVSVAVVETPVLSGYGATATDGFQWGANGSGDFDFDYLRWTNNGGTLFPEPTTLGLLAAGGLLSLSRRRRC